MSTELIINNIRGAENMYPCFFEMPKQAVVKRGGNFWFLLVLMALTGSHSFSWGFMVFSGAIYLNFAYFVQLFKWVLTGFDGFSWVFVGTQGLSCA